MKFFDTLKAIVSYIPKHGFTAFIGFCFAFFNLGVLGYLFYYGQTLFGIVACITYILLVLPFGFDCFARMFLPDKKQKDNEAD